MTLKLFLITAALLTVSGCIMRPSGDGRFQANGGEARHQAHESRDDGDRNFNGGNEGREHRDER